MSLQLVKIVSFLKNPIRYFNYKKISKFQELSITETEFFETQLALIHNANGPLLFFGYDLPFMKKEETIYELSEHIKRTDKQPSIKCIFPENIDSKTLEELAKETNGVKLIKTSEDIKKGYIVFGRIGVSTWDSNKLTYHLEESAKGVIYRDLYLFETKQFPKHFAKMEKNIQSKLSSKKP